MTNGGISTFIPLLLSQSISIWLTAPNRSIKSLGKLRFRILRFNFLKYFHLMSSLVDYSYDLLASLLLESVAYNPTNGSHCPGPISIPSFTAKWIIWLSVMWQRLNNGNQVLDSVRKIISKINVFSLLKGIASNSSHVPGWVSSAKVLFQRFMVNFHCLQI